ncbi:glycoside hydrolase family 97 protein [Mangrovimonas sp. DI 80]|uniref:glycoside hydrolase family 97 protein n=1 Tax=Mangrovimonas sp. DI 80 TaxID=1779330 RepID=UPI000975BB1F|nr:glycoside hydrolase family 97 protein [Mangrovimonas sp. DI 80]OMP30183.1 alpha-glucosidase [Mangrovimonas sp. DI 80]
MKKLTLLLIAIISVSCSKKETQKLLSNPSNNISVEVGLNAHKQPYYLVYDKTELVIDSSSLGLVREDANFFNNMTLKGISEATKVSDKYSMLHGKQKHMSYEANQYTVDLENENGQPMQIVFNLSDDGIAFKYIFPNTSEDIKKITEELTTYNFPTSAKAWVQPMSKAKTGWSSTNPSYEEHYYQNVAINTKSEIGEGWVYPALFNSNNTWVLISETALEPNYCGTHLQYKDDKKSLQVVFPQKEEFFPGGALNPESKLPWETPWRILAIGDLATVTESTLGTDLAKPAMDMDTSFIKGGLASWSWVLLKDDFITYETTKKFIDYSASMNWPYCLIDVNWDQKIGNEKIKELAEYANSKGVKILVWYNSSGDWNETPYTPKSKLLTHDNRAAEFQKLVDLGVSGVKIDFFGGDGQSMIAYYHDILKDAAQYKLLVNFHGCTLPRGWQRTYPHLMTMESIMGEEFVTFDQKNADLQPNHCTMLPFTRNVFDPMDFTPMVLDSITNINRKTTNTFELALPILFTSGVQHMAEIPEGMKKQPDYIVDFLNDIPVNWDSSKFVSGFPGKDVVMARKYNGNWYVVGINGEDKAKTLEMDLSFIGEGNGTMIADEDDKFVLEPVNAATVKTVEVQPYGGFVMKF